MPRPGPQLVVEASRQRVEPVAPRADRPRRRVRLALAEHDLAGAEELARGEERLGRGRALGGEAVVAAPRDVHGVDEAALEAEAGATGGEHEARVGARAAAAALAHVGADGEGVALRRALAQVTSGRVEDLVEVAGHGERRHQRGERVGLGCEVLEREPLAHQARRGDLDGDRGREAGRGIRCGHDGRRGGLVDVDRLGDELRREVPTVAVSGEAGRAEPPGRLLRDERERRRLVEPARDPLRERRRAECRELGLAQVALVDPPEHDHGEGGVAGVEDDARASVAEVEEPGAALHVLFLRQK